MRNLFSKFIFLIVFLLGALAFYRSALNSNDLRKIEGIVSDKRIQVVYMRKLHPEYGLTFTIDSLKTRFGIYIGPHDTIAEKKLYSLLEIGRKYTISIDPTVVSNDNINMGVREISILDKQIYKESQRPQRFIGIAFMFLGLIGFYIVGKYGK